MTETLEYHYTDHLGSVTSRFDNSQVLESILYSTWGSTSSENAQYTGKYLDDTGLYYFNARYYDPEVGRFLSEDPSRQGSGWFTYTGNNPLNRVDLDGMIHNGPGDTDDDSDDRSFGERFRDAVRDIGDSVRDAIDDTKSYIDSINDRRISVDAESGFARLDYSIGPNGVEASLDIDLRRWTFPSLGISLPRTEGYVGDSERSYDKWISKHDPKYEEVQGVPGVNNLESTLRKSKYPGLVTGGLRYQSRFIPGSRDIVINSWSGGFNWDPIRERYDTDSNGRKAGNPASAVRAMRSWMTETQLYIGDLQSGDVLIGAHVLHRNTRHQIDNIITESGIVRPTSDQLLQTDFGSNLAMMAGKSGLNIHLSLFIERDTFAPRSIMGVLYD